MAGIPPRFEVGADDIARVVTEFYAVVRTHPGLGPVFHRHVRDWPAHEEKITRFWRNAILFERCYDGNPMAAHVAAQDVRAPMFEVWLALFDAVLRRELRPEQAAAWSALARRIGRGLRLGVEGARAAPGEVPRLG